MMRTSIVVIALSAFAFIPSSGLAMERAAMDQILAMAKTRPDSPEFRQALLMRLGEAAIKSGEAFDSNGPDFIWAVEAVSLPTLVVDDQPVGHMQRISGTNLWFRTAQLRVGTSHRFHYLVDGRALGGSVDVPAYGPLSYARSGVPQGRISEKLVHTSTLYPGMQTSYWIYVPAQYDPAVPAALMVWQDGERYITKNVEEICRLCPSLYRLQEVTDNLIHDKKIPVMIHVFVSPGTVDGKPLRSVLYDTVSDKYGRFPRYTPNTTSGRMPTAVRFRGSRPAVSRPSTSPSIVLRRSAAFIRWSAASPRSSGSLASSRGATSIRSKCGGSRNATCASG
jgi:hypothetical protein